MARVLVLFIALATQGCSVVIGDTHCFQEVCADASFDAPKESAVDASDAATTDATDASDAVADAPPDVAPDANDVCFKFSLDPCRNVPAGFGGCYCGTSSQSGFDTASANPDCIYRCNDSTLPARTDAVKTCGGACTVAPSGTEDYCSSQSACTASASYCYAHCTD